jgi:hypothetical protein
MFRALSRIWAIDILLAGFVVFFGAMSFNVWSKGDEPLPKIQAAGSVEKPSSAKRIVERAMPPESTYGIVAEKNLFFSNRSESLPKELKELKQGAVKISEKQIFLYGVIVMGDRKKALISNPETAPAAGKKPVKEKWVAVGDTIGTFSVSEIRKDRIILADGANNHEILLYDKNKPARQVTVAEKPAAATVVASGTAAAALKPGTEPSAPRAAEGKSEAVEYKTINTPFGPTKVRIQ